MKARVEEMSILLSQDSDCCDSNDLGQEMTVTTHDGGGGGYVVIETKRWAFDSEEAAHALIRDIYARLAPALEDEQ